MRIIQGGNNSRLAKSKFLSVIIVAVYLKRIKTNIQIVHSTTRVVILVNALAVAHLSQQTIM